MPPREPKTQPDSDKPGTKKFGPAELIAAVAGGAVGFYASEGIWGVQDRMELKAKDETSKLYLETKPIPKNPEAYAEWKKGLEEAIGKESKFSRGEVLRASNTWEKVLLGASIIGAAYGAAKLVNVYRNRDNDKSSASHIGRLEVKQYTNPPSAQRGTS